MCRYTYKLLIVYWCVLSADSFANSDNNEDFQHCVCVPYWQCKEDYSGLIEDGVDILDIRSAQTSTNQIGPCTGDYDVCCQVECGKRRSIINEVIANRMDDDIFGFRILGTGNEAEFAEFPWMLGILEDKKYRCGASLIHPQVALTAAHCLSGKGEYIIRAGEWNWEDRKEPLPHQDRTSRKAELADPDLELNAETTHRDNNSDTGVVSYTDITMEELNFFIIHPRYHPASLRNDVALIILDSPYRLTENVGLACLPLQGMQFDNIKCIATGWGKNSYKKGTYQSTLKKVDLPIVPRLNCLRSLQRARLGPRFNLHTSFICAGGEASKDTCKGDGGSPLMCPVVGQPGRYQQVGIVSWGLTCGIRSTPGVYVNIGVFRTWIDFTMRANGFDTKLYNIMR